MVNLLVHEFCHDRHAHKRQMTDSKIESAIKLLANGLPLKHVAKNLGVSVPTLYRWVPATAQT
jgi:transposase